MHFYHKYPIFILSVVKFLNRPYIAYQSYIQEEKNFYDDPSFKKLYLCGLPDLEGKNQTTS